MLCFGEGKDRVSVWHVVLAARDTLAVSQMHFHASRLKFLAGVVLLALSTMLGWMVAR